MLRKVLWSAVYGVFGAVATVTSRKAASAIWRKATGEEPPAKR